MNPNKYVKPNLVDPQIRKKLINTIKPTKVSYWEPTKGFAQYFYEDYIRPNLFSVILIGIFVIILIYRYTMSQRNKLISKFEDEDDKKKKRENIDIGMLLYAYEKERSLEPKLRPTPSYSYANGP